MRHPQNFETGKNVKFVTLSHTNSENGSIIILYVLIYTYLPSSKAPSYQWDIIKKKEKEREREREKQNRENTHKSVSLTTEGATKLSTAPATRTPERLR